MNENKPDSGADAQLQVSKDRRRQGVKFRRSDLDWIDQTRGKQSRSARLHEVIMKYRGEFEE